MYRYIHSSNEIVSRIIICGGRHFDNYDMLSNVMDDVMSEFDLSFDQIEIVSGHCSGADKLGEAFAKNHNICCKIFPADWSSYGRAAGPIRNSEMISYASESDIPIVVAFVSPKSKGTVDTVNKAKAKQFKVFVTNYDTVESSVSIFSGISLSDNEYKFDWNDDDDGDIVKLTTSHIFRSTHNGNIRYYGYKVNQDIEKILKNNFLSWIKSEKGYLNIEVEEMIDRCIEEFSENNSNVYDYIIATGSSSKLTSLIANKISESFGHAPVISANKLNVTKLKINKNKVIDDLHRSNKSDNYINKMIDYIQKRYIDPQLKSNTYSISHISPRYRKWISPMFEIDNLSDILNANRILVVDETFTTGSSTNQIVSLLRAAGYNKDIDIFTLLNNR